MTQQQNHNPLPRLRWHCRRGMKELDVVLEAYLSSHYQAASAEERAAFAALLELPDPALLYQLTGREPADNEAQARVLEILRRTTHS